MCTTKLGIFELELNIFISEEEYVSQVANATPKQGIQLWLAKQELS